MVKMFKVIVAVDEKKLGNAYSHTKADTAEQLAMVLSPLRNFGVEVNGDIEDISCEWISEELNG